MPANTKEHRTDTGECRSCAALMINGVFCHESGCPDAWRDYQIACRLCGCDFQPESQYQAVCEDCAREEY